MAKTKSGKDNQVATGGEQRIVIRDPEISRIGLELQGTAALILNDFSQKTIEQLLEKHMGGNVARKKKNPRECIENAIPRNQLGVASVTPTAFKQASIAGAVGLTGKAFAKTSLRLTFGVCGQSVPIVCDEMVPRMDIVRTTTGMPDVRFRPQFNGWRARIVVEFAQPLSGAAVVDLVQRGGRVGIGEWRPQNNGVYGTYRVARALSPAEIDEVMTENGVPMRAPRIPEWALDANIDFGALLEAAADETANLPAATVKMASNGKSQPTA